PGRGGRHRVAHQDQGSGRPGHRGGPARRRARCGRSSAARVRRADGVSVVATKTMIEAIREAMAEEMRRDERVIVMGEDVGVGGGVFGATQGLYAEFGALRVLDTPLAESSIVGVAIGAAFNDVLPIA